MTEQRSGRSRRRFLRAASVVGLAAVAGCSASGRSGNDGATRTGTPSGTKNDEGESTTVAILSAGSLNNALKNGLKPAIDVPVRVESHGSTTVARLIAEGKRDPDIVSVADVALFENLLSPPWYSVFTSNAVVIAYNPETEGGKRLAEAGRDRWYEPMTNGEVTVGRTDPDQDPLGYRTLFALELASRYYDGASNLEETIPRREQIYPETSLISRFETGGIDCAFAYRNMAEERGYDYIDLPDRIDLSNPRYEKEWYSTVSYSLPNGKEVHGGLIGYGSTIRKMSDAALEVFATQTTGEYLDEAGFLLREEFPEYVGDVPERVTRATDQSSTNRPSDRSGKNRSDRRETAANRRSTVSDITVLI